jgi:hypothetical protein
MIINIPNNFLSEREYIISMLFNEFLGLECKVNVSDIKDYEIILENKNKLIIKDHFFSKFHDGLYYLDKRNIPAKVKFLKNQFIVENDIPVIYANDELKVSENKIICGIDIFSSSFFMLTRWEEYVNKTRDIHNRFPAYASLVYKNNFLDRPIVSEYVEILWNMLRFLGINQKRKERKFELILTHDVDSLYKWKCWKQVFRTIGGDVLKRKDLKLAISRINEYLRIKSGKQKDPFDTFDYLMEKSELTRVKSHFYFMTGGVTKYDNNYKIDEAVPLIRKIKSRGHIVGFHGSYNSYNNPEQWKKGKGLLEEISQCKVREGRQHYLRFEIPTTWQICEDNKMEIDSTLTYTDREGFRCGTGDEFPVFNILTRKRLNLKERSLIIMDSTIQDPNYRGFSSSKGFEIIKYYIEIAKKYKSKITLLWHNSSFDPSVWAGWKEVYENVLLIQPGSRNKNDGLETMQD